MSAIDFVHAWMLIALLLVPMALVAWVLGTRRAVRRAALISRVRPSGPPYAAAVLLSLAAVPAIIAAAQPRWGSQPSEIPRTGADVVFIVDISRSMDATDVAPSRLGAAKSAINLLLQRLDGDRVGLVVFAGSARLRFPLTSDLAAARQVVSSLETGPTFVEGGTNASIGLETALSAFDLSKPAGRAVVLITDGDDLGADPSDSALRLRNAGIGLIVAGAGTPAGAGVPITDRRNGSVTEKKGADGTPIVTHLNEPFLRALAGAAGGRYAGADLGLLPGIAAARLQSLQSTLIDERTTTVPVERYPWFAGAAMALLVLASLAEFAGRLRLGRLAGVAASALALLLLPACATAAYDANEAGRDALARGDVDAAVRLFSEASVDNTANPQLGLNLAAALNAAGRFDEAILAARRALTSQDSEVRARAYASIGHHEFGAGRLPESLDAFKRALLANPEDEASRHDYEVVLRLLQPPMQEQQPPAQQGDPNDPQPGTQPGQGIPTPGPQATPPAGQPPSGGQTGPSSPGAPSPRSDQQVQRELAAIDAQVRELLEESGDNPDAAQALQILRLLAERSRIAASRDAATNSGPRDY